MVDFRGMVSVPHYLPKGYVICADGTIDAAAIEQCLTAAREAGDTSAVELAESLRQLPPEEQQTLTQVFKAWPDD